MKIIEIEQRSDEWFEARSGLITGTRVKEVKPLSRKGKTGTQPIGLWRLVADYVSFGTEETRPMERGTKLELENAQMCVDKLGLQNANLNCGIWVSDDNMLGYSPDGSENTDKPEWAIECKSLDTAEHLYLVFNDLWAKGEIPDEFESLFPSRLGMYCGIESVAEEHRHQVRQAFVVNPNLKVLYYSLYDPRIVIPSIAHHIITVERLEMEDEITDQTAMVNRQAQLAKAIAVLIASKAKDNQQEGRNAATE
ncbi:MAG: hypothetical protein NC548_27125 [Lachnospiraceae bacterium]|nr:hypothetical protein [Lachnospiraceae bacterium]